MAKATINEYIAKFSKLAETRSSGKPVISDPIVADSATRQLPLWPSYVRGLPNALARSALFNVSNKTAERSYFKMQAISSINGVTITYTGEELRQQDEDVFLQLVHICRERNLGEWVDFTAYSLLKSLGWTINTKSYERLRAILDRLSATNVTIIFEENGESVGFAGSLVRGFEWKTENGQKLQKWRVYFEPKIVTLFAPASYTQIYWELRLTLPPLAKWLHSFYSTHENPFPYKADTLRRLCGSTMTLPHFRSQIREALDKLLEKKFLSSWNHDRKTDLVSVVRTEDVARLAA